jgi:hypothetical protein
LKTPVAFSDRIAHPELSQNRENIFRRPTNHIREYKGLLGWDKKVLPGLAVELAR